MISTMKTFTAMIVLGCLLAEVKSEFYLWTFFSRFRKFKDFNILHLCCETIFVSHGSLWYAL